MKLRLLFLTYVITFINISYSQNAKKLSKFDTSDMKTRILVFNGIQTNEMYKDKTINTYQFYQLYQNITQFDLDNRFPDLNELKQRSKQSYFTNVIPLTILHSQYETILDDAFKNNTVRIEGNQLVRNTSENIFNFEEVTVSAPLRTRKDGLKTTFVLSNDNIFNTTNNTIKSIYADFGDGDGFREISINQNAIVDYNAPGTKEITIKLVFEDNSFKTSKSSILIRPSNSDASARQMMPVTITSSITPDLSVYGESVSYPGQGEYQIFMSTEPGAVLDKPIFIIDGFDPANLRPIVGFTDSGTGNYTSGIYDLLNFTDDSGVEENLADVVRAEGYDVIILNFPEYTRAADGAVVDGGADFIERNAMILVELINQINATKVGTKENVVIGPSMGGLISRYALGYMEDNNLDHETRLWLSFDSPHLGANVPIGFQHQFNFLANGLDGFIFLGNQNVTELQPIVDGMLKSPAARQMLTDHFEPHLDTDSDDSDIDFDPSKALPQEHPFRLTFKNRLQNLTSTSYPENLRKISIINGSGLNRRYQDVNGNNIEVGRQIVNTTFNVQTGADITLRTTWTPSRSTTAESSHVYLDFAWWVPAFDRTNTANAEAFSYSDGIDAASGGLFDLGSLTEGFSTEGTIGNFLAALQTDYFNFIPTVSAMALDNDSEIDWYHQPTNLATSRTVNNITPFDAWYMPDDNEPHVTLTQANVDFALDEILEKLDLSPKMVLQGAMLNPAAGEETLMRDNLRTNNLIPTTSPYSDNATCDSSVFNTTGADAIVDWVWVELRNANDATEVIASRSALLQRDGDVVDTDGNSSIIFEFLKNDFYIALNHRNHLGVMSEAPIALSRLPKIVDFTNNTVTMYGTNATTTAGMPSGLQALWAGDVNGNNSIRYLGFGNDTNMIKSSILNHPDNTNNSSIFQFTGYNNADFNMDGRVRYLGFGNDTNRLKSSILTHPENTTGSTIFTFSQQIPN